MIQVSERHYCYNPNKNSHLTSIQEMLGYISPTIEEAVEEVRVTEEPVEEFTEGNFGLVRRFFRTLTDYIPGF